jgi:hypothetical protein
MRMYCAGSQLAGKWTNPPDWFLKTDYRYLRDLDAAGWLHVLQLCNALQQKVDVSEWEPIGEPGWTKNFIPAFIGPPAVQIVDKADQLALHPIEKPALIIQVALRAPDAVIIDEFKKALRLVRRSVPSPARTRGSKTAFASFRNMHFAAWMNRKIVQLCQLEAWRDKLKEARPSDADMGRWLFSRYANPRKELVNARKTLMAALALIPALSAQVTAVTSNLDS